MFKPKSRRHFAPVCVQDYIQISVFSIYKRSSLLYYRNTVDGVKYEEVSSVSSDIRVDLRR